MRAIDADRLLSSRMMSNYYHLPNGDTAISIIDIATAPTIEAPDKWFSAMTLLPEEDCDVLVYNGLGLEIAAYTTNPVPKWYGRDGHQVYAMFWRFLPGLPKEVTED